MKADAIEEAAYALDGFPPHSCGGLIEARTIRACAVEQS